MQMNVIGRRAKDYTICKAIEIQIGPMDRNALFLYQLSYNPMNFICNKTDENS